MPTFIGSALTIDVGIIDVVRADGGRAAGRAFGGKAGGLRALTQYLRLAGMTAKGQGTVITLDLILTAQAQMKGAN